MSSESGGTCGRRRKMGGAGAGQHAGSACAQLNGLHGLSEACGCSESTRQLKGRQATAVACGVEGVGMSFASSKLADSGRAPAHLPVIAPPQACANLICIVSAAVAAFPARVVLYRTPHLPAHVAPLAVVRGAPHVEDALNHLHRREQHQGRRQG